MKFFELKMRLIAQAVVVSCFIFLSQAALAQVPPPTFQTGDVFVAIGGFSVGDVLGTGKVLWYRPNGTPTPTLVATLDTGQANTEVAGMAFDAAGNLYATVFESQNIVKFDHSGNLISTFGSGFTAFPESILFDSAGNAYVGQATGGGNSGPHEVLKFSSTGTPLGTFVPATEFRGTDWIDFAGDQRTLFYTSEGFLVKRFDVSANAQLPDFATGLPGPTAYAFRILPNGQVLVGDTDRVVLLNTSGTVVQTYCAAQVEVCSSPFSLEPNIANPLIFGLTVDPDGKSFWTADLVAGTVWKVDIATGAIDLTINTGSNDVGGVVVFREITASNSRTLHFGSGTSTQTAPFLGPGGAGDPTSHAIALTANVANPNGIDVTVEAFLEPTEFSHDPTNGVGLADGICEVSQGATEANDFDCRLADGGFVYQTLSNGDQVVPHCSPYHNNMCVWYRATTTALATDQGGNDYVPGVIYKIGYNTNVDLAPSTTEYTPGWSKLNGRFYDRRGEDPDIAFKFDITDFYDVNGNVSAVLAGDQTATGHGKHFNDWVIADVPNPPAGTPADTVERILPVPGISPFVYLKELPMLLAFELENESKEKSDPTALTKPHSVNVGTVDSSGHIIQVQFPAGFPTTFRYNPFFKTYSIFLSPAPYLTDGTVYTMQIGSDLFPQPVIAKFKVCTLAQVVSHTCP